MPASLFHPPDKERLVERIHSLGPQSRRRWGGLSLSKAMGHMGDQLRLALGELEVRPVPGLARLPAVRWAVIYLLPIPRGVRTAPELLTTDLGEIEPAREHLLGLVDRFAERGPDGDFAPHPLFGRLSGKDWGILAAKHLDHHLRQFSA